MNKSYFESEGDSAGHSMGALASLDDERRRSFSFQVRVRPTPNDPIADV
jgi:hypothetical protein